jgi:hypothetical protein
MPVNGRLAARNLARCRAADPCEDFADEIASYQDVPKLLTAASAYYRRHFARAGCQASAS